MMWKKERDLLVAQTMAFVQSVAGKTATNDRSLEAMLPSASTALPPPAERPVDVPPARLTPIIHSDLRDEIRRRVAAFRARQQAFIRERDEYCDAMMAKVRAAREQSAKDRDD